MIFDVSRPDAPFLQPTLKELRKQYDFEKYDGSSYDLDKAVESLDDKSGLIVSKQLILPADFSQRRLKKRGPFRRINRPEKNEAIEKCINPVDYFSQLFSVPDGISAGYMWWGTAPRKVRAVPLVSLIEGYELQEVVNSAWSGEWHGHKACNVRSYEGRGDYAIAVVKVPSRSRADIYDIGLSHIPIGERSYGELWDLFFEHDCADEIWHGYVHFKYVAGVYRFCPHVIAAYLAAGRAEHADF
ncbi:MAG: hypothetical protein HZB66_00710, partial [Candidatus Aenigmarchaeota archaeon]|nr:hypothetical protein [Candidatus Aenigmarchaeota archaeon]